MRKHKEVAFALLLVSFLFLIGFVSSACPEGQVILRLSDETNAHASSNDLNYTVEVCYKDIYGFNFNFTAFRNSDRNYRGLTSPNDCVTSYGNWINWFLSLTRLTNAHGSRNKLVLSSDNTNEGNICYGDLVCRVSASDCLANEKFVLSLSSERNAHFSIFNNSSGGYDFNLCCSSHQAIGRLEGCTYDDDCEDGERCFDGSCINIERPEGECPIGTVRCSNGQCLTSCPPWESFCDDFSMPCDQEGNCYGKCFEKCEGFEGHCNYEDCSADCGYYSNYYCSEGMVTSIVNNEVRCLPDIAPPKDCSEDDFCDSEDIRCESGKEICLLEGGRRICICVIDIFKDCENDEQCVDDFGEGYICAESAESGKQCIRLPDGPTCNINNAQYCRGNDCKANPLGFCEENQGISSIDATFDEVGCNHIVNYIECVNIEVPCLQAHIDYLASINTWRDPLQIECSDQGGYFNLSVQIVEGDNCVFTNVSNYPEGNWCVMPEDLPECDWDEAEYCYNGVCSGHPSHFCDEGIPLIHGVVPNPLTCNLDVSTLDCDRDMAPCGVEYISYLKSMQSWVSTLQSECNNYFNLRYDIYDGPSCVFTNTSNYPDEDWCADSPVVCNWNSADYCYLGECFNSLNEFCGGTSPFVGEFLYGPNCKIVVDELECPEGDCNRELRDYLNAMNSWMASLRSECDGALNLVYNIVQGTNCVYTNTSNYPAGEWCNEDAEGIDWIECNPDGTCDNPNHICYTWGDISFCASRLTNCDPNRGSADCPPGERCVEYPELGEYICTIYNPGVCPEGTFECLYDGEDVPRCCRDGDVIVRNPNSPFCPTEYSECVVNGENFCCYSPIILPPTGFATCDNYFPDGVCSEGESCDCPDCWGEKDGCVDTSVCQDYSPYYLINNDINPNFNRAGEVVGVNVGANTWRHFETREISWSGSRGYLGNKNIDVMICGNSLGSSGVTNIRTDCYYLYADNFGILKDVDYREINVIRGGKVNVRLYPNILSGETYIMVQTTDGSKKIYSPNFQVLPYFGVIGWSLNNLCSCEAPLITASDGTCVANPNVKNPPCEKGYSLCSDGLCWNGGCYDGDFRCNYDGFCDAYEGCDCPDCWGVSGYNSCKSAGGLVCNYQTKTCQECDYFNEHFNRYLTAFNNGNLLFSSSFISQWENDYGNSFLFSSWRCIPQVGIDTKIIYPEKPVDEFDKRDYFETSINIPVIVVSRHLSTMKDLNVTYNFGDNGVGSSKLNPNCLANWDRAVSNPVESILMEYYDVVLGENLEDVYSDDAYCHSSYRYEIPGVYIIEASAKENGGRAVSSDYVPVLVYAPGINIMPIISSPIAGSVIKSGELISFNANQTFVANCTRIRDLGGRACGVGESGTLIVGERTIGELCCREIEINCAQNNLRFDWVFNKNKQGLTTNHTGDICSETGDMLSKYVVFDKTFWNEGNNTVDLNVSYGVAR